MDELPEILNHTLMITVFVFVMMLIVDYVNVLTKGKMGTGLRGGIWHQYVLSSALGATPGCLGAFMNVAFYTRGLLTFGAIVGGMLATSGDEAFVMLALFPKTALLLFGLLFIFGIFFARIIDFLAPLLRIKACEECELAPLHTENEECQCFSPAVWREFPRMHMLRILLVTVTVFLAVATAAGILGPAEWGWEKISLLVLSFLAAFLIAFAPDHYLEEHVWLHIVKSHIWKVLLWTFFALLFLRVGLNYWNLDTFVRTHVIWVLLISGIVGLIPESGPHLVFVTMFATGMIPFSVLVTSSMVQDGHGMLPLFSYSTRDALLIKLFNLGIGLSVGAVMYAIGI
jgi:hypothetical protein